MVEQPQLGPELGATLQRIHEVTGVRRDVLREACHSGALRHNAINRKTYWIYWSDFHAWLAQQSRGGGNRFRSVADAHAQAVIARNAERRAQRRARIKTRRK